ncbi:MAG: sigma-70 family RNA polymerase sigma factor [Spirosomaceae bacterium]|nr:sigma-70 family RNA polymerase sigma factor [Spirosomataceae bacterium]
MESNREKLSRGDEREQFKFYDEHKTAFLFFSKRFDLRKEEAIDVYQDACMVIFENAQNGKLEQVKCNLKTYLFGIGKNLIYKRFQKKAKGEEVELGGFEQATVFDPFEDENQQNQKIEQIRNALQEMGKKCRGVLKKFYFEEKSLEEIMLEMNYDSKNVLKSQKSRCLKQLKELLAVKKLT